MDFYLSYNNREGVLAFPVVPSDGVRLSRTQDNPTFDGVNQELATIGATKLATLEISSFFPNKKYPYLRPWSGADGWAYVRAINNIREWKIPFRAVLLDNHGREIFNMPCTVESFEYGLDRAGDVGYSISFREYRFATTTAAAPAPVAPIVPAQTASQQKAATVTTNKGTYTKRYTSSDATMMAKVMFCEARGIRSKTEIACIGWTILNRFDAGYAKTIAKVITAKNQFAYRAGASTTSDLGYSLVALATDVLDRWSRELAGQTNVGRVLPKGYLWYSGNGKHNYFRNKYSGGTQWNYSLKSPYEN